MSRAIRSFLDLPLWFVAVLTILPCGGCRSGDDGGTDSLSAGTGNTDAIETTISVETGSGSGESSSNPTTGGPEGSSTTGVGPSVCEAVDGEYGDCGQEIGYAFDGVNCTLRTGCDCGLDCSKFFVGRKACASACLAAGECNPERIQGAGAKSGDIGPGDFCDSLRFCDLGLDAFVLLESFFIVQGTQVDIANPSLYAPCTDSLAVVSLGLQGGEITADVWDSLCALSLFPEIGTAWCYIQP